MTKQMTAEEMAAISPEHLEMLRKMAMAPPSNKSCAQYGPLWGGMREGVQGLVEGMQRGLALTQYDQASKKRAAAATQLADQYNQPITQFGGMAGGAVPAMAQSPAASPPLASAQATRLPAAPPVAAGLSVDASGVANAPRHESRPGDPTTSAEMFKATPTGASFDMASPMAKPPSMVPSTPAARTGPASSVPGTALDYGGGSQPTASPMAQPQQTAPGAPAPAPKPQLPGMMRLGGPSQESAAPATASPMAAGGGMFPKVQAPAPTQAIAPGKLGVGQRVYQYFIDKGMQPHQAAAVAGNMTWESGGNVADVTAGDNWKNSPRSPHSFGLGQWNDRLPNLVNFARQRGAPIPEGNLADPNYVRSIAQHLPLETQLDFAWSEMQGPERRAYERIASAPDVASANAGAIGYHRPAGWTPSNPQGGHAFGNRLGLAGQIMKLGGPRPEAQPTAEPVGDTSGAMPGIWNGANVVGDNAPSAERRGFAGQVLPQTQGSQPMVAQAAQAPTAMPNDPRMDARFQYLPKAMQDAILNKYQQAVVQSVAGGQSMASVPPALLEIARVTGNWDGVQKYLTAKHNGTEAPSNVREWEYYAKLSPEEKQKYLTMKRADKTIDLGTSVITPNQASPGGAPAAVYQKDIAGKETQQQLGDARGKFIAAIPKFEMQLSSLDRQNSLIKEEIGRSMGEINWSTTGAIGSIARAVPGTPAYRLRELLGTIKANIGFDRLQQMRAESPTGGALGAVTERELSTLQSVLGSLEQAQDGPTVAYNLQRLTRLMDEAQADRKKAFEYDMQRWGSAVPAASGPAPMPMAQPQAAPQQAPPQPQQAGPGRTGSFAMPGMGGGRAPVPVNTPEEASRLPSGTPIILPDGSIGRVP